MIINNARCKYRYTRGGLICRPTHEMFNVVTCKKCGFEGPQKRFFTALRKKGSPYDHWGFCCPKCKSEKVKTISILMEA